MEGGREDDSAHARTRTFVSHSSARLALTYMNTHAHATCTHAHTYRRMDTRTGRPIAKVACGESHSLAATIDGELLAWGLCCHGRLGLLHPTFLCALPHPTLLAPCLAPSS